MGIVNFFERFVVFGLALTASPTPRSIEAHIFSPDSTTPPIQARSNNAVGSLFVHRLRNCRVYAGPVIGSVLIDEAEGCVFVMASHQIRIHNAKGCDFYLRVRSRPIIEDSSGVRFAPYCLSYEGVEEDLRDASLDEETGNWANVDDFRWLRAVQSPNWSLLPENERVRMVNILDLGGGIEGN